MPTSGGPYEVLYRSTQRLWGAPGKLVTEYVESLQQDVLGQRAIDLGAGEGDNAILLAERGYRVDLVEVSPTAVARISSRIAELPASIRERLRVIHGPVGSPAPRAEFMLVVAYGLLHCFADAEHAAEIARYCVNCVAPGGTLILSTLTDEILPDHAHPELEQCYFPSVAAVRTWFGAFERLREERETLDERHGDGPVHRHSVLRAMYRRSSA